MSQSAEDSGRYSTRISNDHCHEITSSEAYRRSCRRWTLHAARLQSPKRPSDYADRTGSLARASVSGIRIGHLIVVIAVNLE